MTRSIVLTIETTASRESLFEAITTSNGLRSFWTPDADAEAREGGDLRFGFAEAPVDLEMTVESLEPGEAVTWVEIGPWPGWQGTRVEWSIEDDGERRTVVFAHRDWAVDVPDRDFGSVAMTWAQVILALGRYAETGEANPALA